MASWTLVLAAFCTDAHFLYAHGDRSAEPVVIPPIEDPVTNFIDNNHLGKQLFDPETSDIGKNLAEMDRKDSSRLKAAKQWAQGTYEAMKNARRIVVQATNKAQNVLLRDALQVSAAATGNFEEETKRAQIRDVGSKAVIQKKLARLNTGAANSSRPEELLPDYKTIRLVINKQFGSKDKELKRLGPIMNGRDDDDPRSRSRATWAQYHGKSGQLVRFIAKMGRWLIRPDDPTLKDVWADLGDFDMSNPYDQDLSMIDDSNETSRRLEAVAGGTAGPMAKYAGKRSHVYIDNLKQCTKGRETPEGIRDGHVIGYRDGQYQISVEGVDPLQSPWCPPSAFHGSEDIEGALVMVKNPGWVGRVLSWDSGAGGGTYKVKVLGSHDYKGGKADFKEADAQTVVKMPRDAVQSAVLSQWEDALGKDYGQLVDKYVKIETLDGRSIRGKVAAYTMEQVSESAAPSPRFVIEGAEYDRSGKETKAGRLQVDEHTIASMHKSIAGSGGGLGAVDGEEIRWESRPFIE